MDNELDTLFDTANIFRFHTSLIQKHGEGTGALGWSKPEGQQARFGMLSQMANFNHRTVLDAGCGHADLYAFLKNKFVDVDYYGLEQIPTLLDVADDRFKDEKGITLLLGNFLQSPLASTDYVLASGSLSYRHHDESFIYKAIQKLYSHCILGFGFNLLSGGVAPASNLVAYDPHEIFTFCNTLSIKTDLHQGYWKDDFTIFMYR